MLRPLIDAARLDDRAGHDPLDSRDLDQRKEKLVKVPVVVLSGFLVPWWRAS